MTWYDRATVYHNNFDVTDPDFNRMIVMTLKELEEVEISFAFDFDGSLGQEVLTIMVHACEVEAHLTATFGEWMQIAKVDPMHLIRAHHILLRGGEL